MIPVSTFKGMRVALFGLGGSGLATARALVEGGADLMAFDDNPDRVEAARAEGIPVGDFRESGLHFFAALVLAHDPIDAYCTKELSLTISNGPPSTGPRTLQVSEPVQLGSGFFQGVEVHAILVCHPRVAQAAKDHSQVGGADGMKGGYHPVIAAIPGSSFPSRYSSMAPPPVLT